MEIVRQDNLKNAGVFFILKVLQDLSGTFSRRLGEIESILVRFMPEIQA